MTYLDDTFLDDTRWYSILTIENQDSAVLENPRLELDHQDASLSLRDTWKYQQYLTKTSYILQIYLSIVIPNNTRQYLTNI